MQSESFSLGVNREAEGENHCYGLRVASYGFKHTGCSVLGVGGKLSVISYKCCRAAVDLRRVSFEL